jgi:hypothetical protein
MKKNKWYVLGMWALTLVFALVLAGCGPNMENEGDSKQTAIPLTFDTWTDGYIAAADSDRSRTQWFKFTATAATQFIFVSYSSLSNIYMQLYDSGNDEVGSEENFWGSTGGVGFISRTVSSDETYYIKVWPRSGSGTYRIGFTDFPKRPETPFTELTLNTWANGYIAPEGSGAPREQWFKFTATAATQYIHVSYDSLTNLYAQLYDSGVYEVGSNANFWGSVGGVESIPRLVSDGTMYYIKVWPRSGSGTYRIGFTTSTTPPTSLRQAALLY